MPRPRRSRPRAGRSSASARASPTSRPRRTSSRPRSRPAATRRTTATPPPAGCPELKQAIADKTLRDSGLRGRARPGRGHQRRQAGHLRGVRDDARPGRRGDRARAVLDDVPRGDPARRRRRRPGAGRRDPGLQGHRRAARGGAHRAHQGAALRLAVQPDRRGLHRRRDPGDRRAGSRSTASGCSPTRSTSTSSTTASRPARCRCCAPASADNCVVVNGVAKTYAMTGWRVGWMIAPAGPRQGRHQPAVPRDLQRRQRLPARRARRGDRRPVRGRRDEGRLRPAPHARSWRCSTRSTASSARRPRARSTPTRRSRALLGREYDGPVVETSADLAEYILDEAEVAVVPGEAFGTPGYLRLVLRPRRRRPGRGRSPGCRSSSPELRDPATPARRARRAVGRRSLRPAEGASAPALHRVDAARDAARAGRARRHPAARLAGRASGRRSCRRPTRRAGSGSSGSTTSPGRCCAPRTTYAGWCARPPRTTSRDGGRWLEIQVDPSGYAARFGGITAFTDLVLDAVARGLGGRPASGSPWSSRPTAPVTRWTRGPWPGSPASTPVAGSSASGSPTTSAGA